ncbi:retrovirus-related pol polyprotein from transposon TNT 1-94 [Tanacetum coccineum]
MYLGGKVNYVDNIDVDLFNVDEVHMFVPDLGYDPKQLMFYHFNLPNKSLDYGLRPLSCDADVVSLINIVEHLSVEIEELDDDVELNAYVVESSKRLALGWINKDDVGESMNVNDYTIDDSYEFNIDENLNLDDYTVYVDENMNVNVDENINVDENVNVHENENVNADENENVNADEEQDSDEENKQDSLEDEQGRGNDREDFIVDEEHVIDEVEVNMKGFSFSVEEQGADPGVTPNVDLTDEALEVLDFDSFDSDVGGDTASIRRRNLRKLRKTGGQSCGIVNTLFVGQEFPNKELAKARIKAHAVETRRKIRIVKNESERVQAKCKGNVVESGNLSHACGAVGKETGDSVSHGKNKLKVLWGVSKTKAFRAKAKAEVHLKGDQEQQYALLRDYCDALKKANPNTTVKIDVYRVDNPHGNVRRFKRIYVCLGPLKDGFRASRRQLLGLDGALMKGNYPGQMIIAVSMDANNGLYPIEYGIVESESKDSWTWFLSCLRDDFDLYANLNFTFIIDRQKGPLPALQDLFPAAEHRYCCATAKTEVHFKRAMDEFKGYNRTTRRANCDLLINNIYEVFNRQLLEARDSHVITALEYVREYLMKRIVIVQKVIEKSQGPLTPTVTKIFNVIKEKASQSTVVWDGAEQFQVNEGRQNLVVMNLANRSCSCRKWEVSGIPCKHAIACNFNMTDNGMQVGLLENLVHQSMRLQTWKTVYSFKINPVHGKKRKKSAGEMTEMVKNGKLTRKGGTATCCKCGQKGPNKRICKGPSVAGGSASGAASINALHLSSTKIITTLNEEIANLNNQLSKEKSIVSYLEQEREKLKSDFKTREDELLDKLIQSNKKIKELDNILVKTGQSIQMMHMLSPKPYSFYHTEQKMALGYQYPFYLKQAQQKQQSLYNGKVLLDKHDPPAVYDLEEKLKLAQESRLKMKQLKKEIKPTNYRKISKLFEVFVSQMDKSREEVYFSNAYKPASVSNTISKPISIPDDDFSDDTTPSVARKFLNEVKDTIMTLQRVVKSRMSLNVNNWSSHVHQEVHKILKDEISLIVNQVDVRVNHFEMQFLKEVAKFVRDFKSLTKEADESLDKITVLENENKRLLRAVVSQDIMSIVQSPSVVDTSDLQTELDRTKEKFETCIIKKENEYAKL